MALTHLDAGETSGYGAVLRDTMRLIIWYAVEKRSNTPVHCAEEQERLVLIKRICYADVQLKPHRSETPMSHGCVELRAEIRVPETSNSLCPCSKLQFHHRLP